MSSQNLEHETGWISTTYGMRDIEPDDEVIRTNRGILLRKGGHEMYMVFRGLKEYCDWTSRNADRLGGDPETTREIAKCVGEILAARGHGGENQETSD